MVAMQLTNRQPIKAINFKGNAEKKTGIPTQKPFPGKEQAVTVIGSLRSSPEQFEKQIIPLYKEKGIDLSGEPWRKMLVSDYITPYIEMAHNFGKKAAQNGWNIITGGGPGTMHAASSGAHEVDPKKSSAVSVEKWAKFNLEQTANLLHVAKFAGERSQVFSQESKYLAMFPGGFGSWEEAFAAADSENPPKKIFMVGKEYYQPLMDFMHTAEKYNLVQNVDEKFELVDSEAEILEKIGSPEADIQENGVIKIN